VSYIAGYVLGYLDSKSELCSACKDSLSDTCRPNSPNLALITHREVFPGALSRPSGNLIHAVGMVIDCLSTSWKQFCLQYGFQQALSQHILSSLESSFGFLPECHRRTVTLRIVTRLVKTVTRFRLKKMKDQFKNKPECRKLPK